MREIVKDIAVTDDEARKFYDSNPAMFKNPERVHARHILVSGDENLAKVQAELKAGKSFDVVAKEYSIDPGSAANGGDLGEFPRGMMVPEFEKAAFELKNPGDVSAPVKTQFGWHIIKLEERIPESPIPFEQVKARLLQELKDQKTQQALQDRAKELEGKYKVERLYDKPQETSPDK
ncbi:MAG: peptidylprolyl isomerase [Synergistaceae bacterium]|nr:peptidylprolyl isomerase [Synergistaceae bacterium]